MSRLPPRAVDAALLLDQLRRERPWQRAPEAVRRRALGQLETVLDGELRVRPRRRALRRGLALAALLLVAGAAGWRLSRERDRHEAAAVALRAEPPRAIPTPAAGGILEPATGALLPPAAGKSEAPPSAPALDVPEFEATTIAVARGTDRGWLATPNLLHNGDFAHGDQLWSVRRLPDSHGARHDGSAGSAPLAGAAYRLRQGLLCLSLSARQRTLGVWGGEGRGEPAGFPLLARRRYRLSLRVAVSGALPIELLVQVEPGTSAPPFVVAALPRHAAPQYFTVDFEPAVASAAARFAFLARAAAGAGSSELCLDDIAITGG